MITSIPRQGEPPSFNHNLLRPNAVAVNQTQNINPWRHPTGRDALNASATGDDDAPHHVNDLQHTLAVDDDVAVADEREGP